LKRRHTVFESAATDFGACDLRTDECVHTAAMGETRSQIDIAVPAALVWVILADLGLYGRWNPLIRGILGKAEAGRRIEISLLSSTGSRIRTQPTIVHLREEREMRWCERWRVPGLFASERRFSIESLPQGGVRFHHSERTDGILVSLLGYRRRSRSKTAFDAMNTALKLRAERAWARQGTASAA
jgi:hypothetical protein